MTVEGMWKAMFQKDEYVVYKTEGVCRVDDIRPLTLGSAGERLCYVLVPLNKKASHIFVPLDSELLLARMRPMMTKEAVDAAIDSVFRKRLPWIEERKRRTALFKAICAESRCEKLILLFLCLSDKQEQLMAEGKRLTFWDSEILVYCEAVIGGEFSMALGISPGEVLSYIRGRLEKVALPS